MPAEYYARILQSRMNQLRRVKESAAAREMQPGSELIEEVHFVPPGEFDATWMNEQIFFDVLVGLLDRCHFGAANYIDCLGRGRTYGS